MNRLLPLALLTLLVACSDDTTESCFDDPTIPECVESCMEDPSQAFCDLDDMGTPDMVDTGDMGPCGDCGDQLCDTASGMCVDCLSEAECTTAEASACGTDGSCEVCATDDDCDHDGLPPVCVAGIGCFECGDEDVESDDCSGETPVCDGTERSCRACAEHSECAAGLCVDGACPAASDIVWVDGDDGACDDGGTGASATPFCEVQAALDAGSAEYVAVRDFGDPYEPITWTGGGTVTVVAAETGDSNARLLSTSGTGDTVTCEDSTLTLVGLMVAGSGNQDGINASGCTLTLTDVSVSDNGQAGVSATGGTVTLTDVSVSDNVGVGVSASADADVTIRRCVLQGNDGGGLSLSGVHFEVENSLIGGRSTSGNGSDSSTLGGVLLATPMAGSRFVHNTVVGNDAPLATAGGVICGAGVTIENSIIWNNMGMTNDTAGCTLTSSSEGVDPQFEADGYHLTSTSSCCIDMADDSAAPDDDIDGQERPCGDGADIGADEFCP